jgi:hypothetical protein
MIENYPQPSNEQKKRVDYSTKLSVNLDLSPLLLRQTFVNVLDEMNIPYISALGEGDDECVSLANHLNCYLISRDSDYYCYNLTKGYIPFDYVDINPVKKDSLFYLSAQLYTLDSLLESRYAPVPVNWIRNGLGTQSDWVPKPFGTQFTSHDWNFCIPKLERFDGLNPSTLSLACCLCENGYIKGDIIEPIFNHIVATVEKSKQGTYGSNKRTKHWYPLQYMRRCENVEIAFEKLLEPIKKVSDKDNIEIKLRSALEPYLHPTDTLIYRFASSTNENLRKNPYFNQLAQDYLDTLDLVMKKS